MKEVILLGTGPSRKECSWDAEVWTVNAGYVKVLEMGGFMEKLFIAHGTWKQPPICGSLVGAIGEGISWEDIAKVIDWGVQVITLHRIKGIKSTLYPLKRIIKKLGTNYFTNTISYMIAYAIDKNYEKIRLYGIDMTTELEYKWERPCVSFWVGYAMGRGIKVNISLGSIVCKIRDGQH